MEEIPASCLFKKTPAKSEHSTEELDSCTIAYLELLEQYNKLFPELQSQLKAAFFDLAKSKLALGPARIGQNSYDLTSHLPIKTITTHSIDDPSGHETQIHPSKFKTGPSFILSSNKLECSTSTELNPSLSIGTTSRKSQPGPDGILRKRKPNQVEETSSNGPTLTSEQTQASGPDDELKKHKREDLTRELTDPIYQFSALPPPSLRAAQAGFSRSLESIVKLSDLRLRLFEFERQILIYKQHDSPNL